MPPIELNSSVVVSRVSDKTKAAFKRRAAREGKRPSAVLRELIEQYAHSKTRKSVAGE